MRFRQYLKEAKSRKLVTSFGRMNPPTIGHQKLIEKVAEVARKEGADWKIFLSHSQDPKKNPLKPARKLFWLHQMFPKYKNHIELSSKVKTFFNLPNLFDGQYDELIIVAGDDRTSEYESKLNTYNGRDYNFESIRVVSAGKRSENATGVEGMSASKLRKFVSNDDFDSFLMGVPLNEKNAMALFNEMKKEMGIK